MKKLIWTIVVIAIIIVCIVAAVFGFKGSSTAPSTSTTKNQEPSTYKIGVIAPLTGDAAVYGEPAVKIYQIAVDEINAAGGINGKNIELVVQDGKCNGEGAVNAAQQLVNVVGVKAIIGGFCSGESLAAIPVAEAKNVALISPSSSSPDLTGKSKIFFRDFPSDSSQGAIIAQVAYDKGFRKIAFLQEQTDYSVGIYKAFSEKFQQLGGTVVKEEFPTAEKDFRSQLTKLKAGNPNAIFVDSQTPAASEKIFQQMKDLGWKTTVLLNDVAIGNADLVPKYKDILEGAIGAEFGVDPSNPKFKHLIDTYKTKFNAEPPYQSYAQTEYDAVYLIKDAIASVGYDGAKIAAWGHQVKDWQGASGLITIESNGDLVGGHRPEMVKNGKVVPYVK